MTLDLLQMKSRPHTGAPLDNIEARSRLSELPGWQLVDGGIEKMFKFEDFFQVMAFVNALAWIAHTEDHHPDLSVSFSHCEVRFSTHSVGGLSINDFICAAKTDALGVFGG